MKWSSSKNIKIQQFLTMKYNLKHNYEITVCVFYQVRYQMFILRVGKEIFFSFNILHNVASINYVFRITTYAYVETITRKYELYFDKKNKYLIRQNKYLIRENNFL